MTQFYISRHGQTANNKSKTFSGWVDTPLTEQGVLDAQSTAAKLDGITFDVIISSDLGRAFITAYLISRRLGYTDEILRSASLREVSYGDMGQVSIAEAHKTYPGLDTDTNFVAPNGESLGQMQQRVLEFIAQLNEQYDGRTVLLVAHGGVIDAIKANFLGKDIGEFMTTEGITNSHDYVAKFQMHDGKVVEHQEIA
jgi:probable phosphoglycerate mutase